MKKREIVKCLIAMILKELPQYTVMANHHMGKPTDERRLLRGLMNVCPPALIRKEFFALQDQLLIQEREEKGVVDINSLPTTANSRIVLWQGDITRLKVDAIVNAANNEVLGCFVPCHGCVDNAIHSAAGLQLRKECYDNMRQQGFKEPIGCAKITKAYNLPARHVLHTVGPIVRGELTEEQCEELAQCYRSCLVLASAHNLSSIAFCCISTGEYQFPRQRAAEIAVQVVGDFLYRDVDIHKVIFNVFTKEDENIYEKLLLSEL